MQNLIEMPYDEFERLMETEFPDLYNPELKYGGFDIQPGWRPLVYKLSKCIQDHVRHVRKTIPDFCFVVEQIKEKFGGLRFYFFGGDEWIDGMVRLAEYLAISTCEVCGEPGKQRGDRWIVTRCDAHS